MFTSGNTARKDQETYCIYEDPEMSKATVTIGSNRTSATDLVNYPPAEYVDLPNKLAPVKLIGDWPIYWPYLLGQTLRDKWYRGDMLEDQVTLENIE